MRALVKPESSEYFRRYEKPVQDPQVTMNNIQAKKLSLAVGIDAAQAKQLAWFFELVTKLKLPQHYTRFLSPSKDQVIYFNEKTHQQSREHPSTNILKIFFYETLANNKAIYTFTDKQGKLLPFVQEKMLRQSIGLNSKRREAEKVNLQRDESGRMVMSKLEKINPDFKSLLASRSYMLKMLVEKVFTRKEIVGKGKRANAFLSIISEYRNMMKQSSPQKQDEQQQNEQNLALYHKIFEGAASFYQFEMGQLKDIPPSIINSRQYIESTPQNVLKNIFLLNIDKDSIELYWLARMMDCLPLPPNWTKRKGTSFDSYLYQPEQLQFDIHPSYIYLMRQLNQFKAIFRQLGALQQNYYLTMRQLNYFDFFERKYTVDMYGYIEKAQNGNNKQEKPDLQMSQNSDWMVLQGIKNTPIVPQAYVLIEHIEKFWDCLNFKDEAWCPAISPYGEVVWSSNVNFKSISFNPYRAKLTNLIKNELKEMPQITDSVLKPEYIAREQPQQQHEEEEEIHLNTQKIQQEREQFLGYYLKHLEKALPWPYELKPHFQLLDQNNYYEQIFTSPFDLDAGITKEGQQVPLWLQKARAKNHTIHHTNLLIFNPQNFLAIKEKVVAYALDMVGEHEPHMLEQTEKKLNRINNPEDLLKFLNYINDLDLREQRKKDYLQSLKKNDLDSDIFGSEISQVQVEERLQEEEVQQAEVEKKEVEVLKQPSVHEKSVHEQSQPEMPSEPEEESVTTVQQVIPQREQYGFLRNFQRKRYFRPSQMSWLREEEIERMISKAMKMKRRKAKYKQGAVKGKVNRQLSLAKDILDGRIIFIDQSRIEQRKSFKKNLVVTHLRSNCIPYRLSINTQLTRNDQRYKKRPQSEDGCSQITDYQQFRSELGEYDAGEIDEMLIEIKKNKKPQEIVRAPTERSLNEHEQTNDTIQLEPIHQIKPEIGLDPVLRHVKRLSVELNQFRSTFNSKHTLKITPQKDMRDNIRKVDSLKSLASKEANYASTPLPRNSSLKKLDIQSRLSFVRKEGMGGLSKQYSTQRPFQRVCLEKTASHFLEKEAFLKKGDLITMEARKTLLSKGRGLETFISKYY